MLKTGQFKMFRMYYKNVIDRFSIFVDQFTPLTGGIWPMGHHLNTPGVYVK